MAIEFVGSVTGSKVGHATNSSTLTLSSGLAQGSRASVQAGDLVIAVFATGSTANRTLSITDGTTDYTLIDSELYSDDNFDTNLRVAYKFMGVTPDSSVTFGPTGDAADGGTMAAYVFAGVDPTTPLDVAAVSTTGQNTGRPVPGSITPVTAGAFVLVVGAASYSSISTLTAPADQTDFQTVVGNDNNDSALGIGYIEWTSGAVNPLPFIGGGTTNAQASWAAISIALRPDTTGPQVLLPSLYIDADTFYGPTVTRGAVDLAPSLYADADTFHAATVTSTYALTPALFTDGDTFYSPAVTTGAVTLTPSLYADADAFYSPTITRGAVDLTPSLFSDGDTFHSPAVTSLYTLSPSLLTDGDTFHSPTVTAGAVALTPSLFSDGDTFYSPAVTSLYTLAPSLYADGDTFHGPTISVGAVTLSPSLYSDADTFYTQVVTVGSVTLAPALYEDPDTFYGHVVTAEGGDQFLVPELYADPDSFYSPAVSVGGVTLSPSLFVDADSFYGPIVTAGTALAPELFVDADAFYSPTVTVGAVSLSPSLFVDGDTFYGPIVTGGEVAEEPEDGGQVGYPTGGGSGNGTLVRRRRGRRPIYDDERVEEPEKAAPRKSQKRDADERVEPAAVFDFTKALEEARFSRELADIAQAAREAERQAIQREMEQAQWAAFRQRDDEEAITALLLAS